MIFFFRALNQGFNLIQKLAHFQLSTSHNEDLGLVREVRMEKGLWLGGIVLWLTAEGVLDGEVEAAVPTVVLGLVAERIDILGGTNFV
jgi:hypothetical protein